MSATNAIQQLKTVLTGLVHEDGLTALQTIWPYPPEDPASGNFPALAIEMAPDAEFKIVSRVYQTPGRADDLYPLNLYLFVGAPAAGLISELHDRALGWRVPLYKALSANANLNQAVVILMGEEGEFSITGKVGQILWNNVPLYGIYMRLWLTEFVDV